MKPTTIAKIDIAPFEPAFLGQGYMMSFVHQTRLFHRLIRVTLENGAHGVGEVIRWPTYAPAEAAELEDAVFAALIGRDVGELPVEIARCRERDFRLIGAAHGLDTAYHDLIGRAAGVPVHALLGGLQQADVPEVLSLSCESPETMMRDIDLAGGAFPVVQAKLGRTDDLAEDDARLRAVLSRLSPDQLVLADFNGALTPGQAEQFCARFDDRRIVWEEPCETYEMNRDVARAVGAPILFDQCLRTPEICVRAVRDGVAWGMVVKPGLLGGLAVTRFLRDLCASSGIRMRIDGPWCGQIGAVAALHLSVGCPPHLLLGSIDLTDAVDTPGDLIGRPAASRLAPPPGVGLGDLPDDFFERETRAVSTGRETMAETA